MVEWIEISSLPRPKNIFPVSTLVVEWIEIRLMLPATAPSRWSPPSWWSGLKSCIAALAALVTSSPPSWWSGLKSPMSGFDLSSPKSPPSWWSGLKFIFDLLPIAHVLSPPSWWSGLKYRLPGRYPIPLPVSTLVVEWIEISGCFRIHVWVQGLHPRGGVD